MLSGAFSISKIEEEAPGLLYVLLISEICQVSGPKQAWAVPSVDKEAVCGRTSTLVGAPQLGAAWFKPFKKYLLEKTIIQRTSVL